ncbi:recombination regulator RecX [Lactobacillus sp.]|uniref:recombination regulator RecX n=1 Tax=Lactobacillus sp. TaxID=1591 RepID=UPI0019B74327|nr:recombination regulator RecX [Lactobacillus sp.]MBD5430316.1 recombination regulator RecX [Lactobacillus sp.]
MSVITKVTTQKRKGYYNIYLDGEFAFGVSERTLANFRLLPGNELTTEQIREIKNFESDAKAVEIAINYLSYQPRSIYEVLRYLKKHEVSEIAAQNAITQLTDLGYLDDKKFVELFIKNNIRVGKDGPRTLERKLAQKGVDSQIIMQSLAEVEIEEWQDPGLRVVHSLVYQSGKLSLKEIKRKAKTKLMSHGFMGEIADMIIENLNLSEDEDEQLEALRTQGIKAYRRYRNQDDFSRRQKVRRYLLQHGFSSDEVNSFLNGDVCDLEELNDY